MVEIQIDALGPSTHIVNPLFFGCHSDSGYGHQVRGLYSQLVWGESFEIGGDVDSGASNGWTSVFRDQGQVELDRTQARHGWASKRLTVTKAQGHGGVGVANLGLGSEGIYFEGGKLYEGYLFARAAPAMKGWAVVPLTMRVTLEHRDHPEIALAAANFQVTTGEWMQYHFELTPSAELPCDEILPPGLEHGVDCGQMGPEPGHSCVRCAGQVVVTLIDEGTVWIDYVFLEPGPWGRFQGLSVHKQAVEALQAMGVTTIRQGGPFINGDSSDNGETTVIAPTRRCAVYGAVYGVGCRMRVFICVVYVYAHI